MISCNSLPIGHADIKTVDVYKSDGSRQCETGSGISLSEMERILNEANIRVLSSRQDHDCKMRPAVCGAGTGVINIFEIEENNLGPARELGFIPLSRLKAQCGN